jgi:hypothetical protein
MLTAIVSILLLLFLVVSILFEVFAQPPPTPWDHMVVEGPETKTDGTNAAVILATIYACVFVLTVVAIFV